MNKKNDNSMCDDILENEYTKFKKIYEKNPYKVLKDFSNFVISEEKKYNNTKININKVARKNNIEKIFNILCIIIMLVMGLIKFSTESDLQISYTMTYFFGFIFFIAGYFVATEAILFLFTHGGVGLSIMVVPTIDYIMENPMTSENPTMVYLFIGISLLIIIIAFVLRTIYSLSKKIREYKYTKFIPLALFTIGLAIIRLIPLFIKYIIRI